MSQKSTTYYVSSRSGDDKNSGLSESAPFLTLEKIEKISLMPGDKVLLERGSVFENQFLHLKNCGSADEQPIEIASYGSNDAPPRINANGKGLWYQNYGSVLDYSGHVYKGDVSSSILLYDSENIVIRDLEITNKEEYVSAEAYSAADKLDRTGVSVVAQNRGTVRSITLDGLFVHDVNGNVYDKHMNNGGIYMSAFKPENEEKTGAARFDGITVKNCIVKNVSRWGIAVGYLYNHEKFKGAELSEETFEKFGNKNIVISNNYLKSIGGDGITPMYALRPLVEHNTADTCATEMNDRIYRNAGKRMGKVAAAIWPWKCKNALLRFNSAVDTKLNQDGMAYDADSGDGTVYEYNYSRLNEGGCIMFCEGEAIHNTFKNNLSVDDLGGLLTTANNPDAYVANNSFFVRKGVPLKRKRLHGKLTFVDNKITIIDKD